MAKTKTPSRYERLIEKIFFDHYKKGAEEFEFDRSELIDAAQALKFDTVKNVGDVVYTYRYRKELPAKILATQPRAKYWLILGAGDARYRFRLSRLAYVHPTPGLLVRKVPDATPEIIAHYAFTDEQALPPSRSSPSLGTAPGATPDPTSAPASPPGPSAASATPVDHCSSPPAADAPATRSSSRTASSTITTRPAAYRATSIHSPAAPSTTSRWWSPSDEALLLRPYT